jgi:hypothetical protein
MLGKITGKKEGVFVEKELVEFLNGTRNTASAIMHLGRQNLPSAEKIFIGVPDAKDALYVFYKSKAKPINDKSEKVETETGFEFKSIPADGTGGKEAYVIVMLSRLEKISTLSIEAKAIIFDLLGCIEWNTGRLIRQRDKTSLTIKMIARMSNMGIKKARKTMSELKDNNVIRYEIKDKAYYLSRHFVKKGEERQ